MHSRSSHHSPPPRRLVNKPDAFFPSSTSTATVSTGSTLSSSPSSRSSASSPSSRSMNSNNSSSPPSSHPHLPPPPRIKRSTATRISKGNQQNSPPHAPFSHSPPVLSSPPATHVHNSTLQQQQQAVAAGVNAHVSSTPKPSPPPPPRIRRLNSRDAPLFLNNNDNDRDKRDTNEISTTPLLSSNKDKKTLSQNNCNGNQSSSSSRKSPPRLYQAELASMNERQMEQQALLSDIRSNLSSTNNNAARNEKKTGQQIYSGQVGEQRENSDDIYAQLDQFGQQLDNEISDLEKLGVIGHHLDDEISGLERLGVVGTPPPMPLSGGKSSKSKKTSKRADKKKMQQQKVQDHLTTDGIVDDDDDDIYPNEHIANRWSPPRKSKVSRDDNEMMTASSYGRSSSVSSTPERKVDSSIHQNRPSPPPRLSPPRDCTPTSRLSNSRSTPTGQNPPGISPPKRSNSIGPPSTPSPANTPPKNSATAGKNNASFNNSSFSNSRSFNNSHISLKSCESSSSFSSATVQAALVERLRAKEKYLEETQRMQSLFDSNKANHVGSRHGAREELSQIERNDQFSAKTKNRQASSPSKNDRQHHHQALPRSGKASTASSTKRAFASLSKQQTQSSTSTNQQHQEEAQHDYEMQIHPDSIQGTAEAAAWHLHGVSGGRRQQQQSDNYSVMSSRGLRNAGGRGDDDDDSNDDNEDAFDENCGMNDGGCKVGSGIRMGMDVEEGMTTLSASKAMSFSPYTSQTMHKSQHCDQWSTGVAAAIATSTATRYYKSFFLFPHGRRVLLPIFMGAMACALSLFVVFSCQFMTLVLVQSNASSSMVNQGSFQLGPWRYLSINPSYSDGEVCLPYPSDMVMDTNFMIARSTSALASCLGCALVLWTCTLLCAPATKGSMNCLGLSFAMNGIMQCMTAIFYQSQNCKVDGEGGYFGHGECRPNQDLVFSVAAGILYLATGWILCMSHNFAFSTNSGVSTMAGMEVHTWSSEAKSSNPKRGILRTVEKSWVKVPNGSTVMATVFVEQRKDNGNINVGNGSGKMKTTYQIRTEILPA